MTCEVLTQKSSSVVLLFHRHCFIHFLSVNRAEAGTTSLFHQGLVCVKTRKVKLLLPWRLGRVHSYIVEVIQEFVHFFLVQLRLCLKIGFKFFLLKESIIGDAPRNRSDSLEERVLQGLLGC